MKSCWISRQLENWREVCKWAAEAGVKKVIPPEQMHLTLATIRDPVDWSLTEPRQDMLVIERGEKPVQIFAWTIKALTFSHPALERRHAELCEIYPTIDHPDFRPHLSLYKGGRMPKLAYDGPLIFGPERMIEFNPDNSKGIKHVKVDNLLKAGTGSTQ